MAMSLEVIGKNRIKAILNRLEGGMGNKLVEALSKIGDDVKKDAKELCPVDTGSLRDSIRKEAVARPAGNIWEVGVRAGGYITNPKTSRKVDYAIYVEFGTSRNRPQPFLRPALQKNSAAIMDAIGDAVNDTITEA